METTILYGNGVNLLGGGKSWEQILKDISDKPSLPPIQSNTLKYEYIILPQKEIDRVCFTDKNGVRFITADNKLLIVNVNTEENLKRELSLELQKNEPSSFYQKLAESKAEHFITTNYELFLNNTFVNNDYHIKSSVTSDSCLYRHVILEKEYKKVSIWNIHGDINNSNSIMLGLSDYCKYVAEIDNFLNSEIKNEKTCWVNLLFNTNVHIIGFGMAYEEIDIWNVLTTRMRLKRKNQNLCTNKIVYYAIRDCSFDFGKNHLLEALGVDVVEVPFDYSNDAYNKAYDYIYDKLTSNT